MTGHPSGRVRKLATCANIYPHIWNTCDICGTCEWRLEWLGNPLVFGVLTFEASVSVLKLGVTGTSARVPQHECHCHLRPAHVSWSGSCSCLYLCLCLSVYCICICICMSVCYICLLYLYLKITCDICDSFIILKIEKGMTGHTSGRTLTFKFSD